MRNQNKESFLCASKPYTVTKHVCRFKDVKLSIRRHTTEHSSRSCSRSTRCSSSNQSVTSGSSATFLLMATVVSSARWLAGVARHTHTWRHQWRALCSVLNHPHPSTLIRRFLSWHVVEFSCLLLRPNLFKALSSTRGWIIMAALRSRCGHYILQL